MLAIWGRSHVVGRRWVCNVLPNEGGPILPRLAFVLAVVGEGAHQIVEDLGGTSREVAVILIGGPRILHLYVDHFVPLLQRAMG